PRPGPPRSPRRVGRAESPRARPRRGLPPVRSAPALGGAAAGLGRGRARPGRAPRGPARAREESAPRGGGPRGDDTRRSFGAPGDRGGRAAGRDAGAPASGRPLLRAPARGGPRDALRLG